MLKAHHGVFSMMFDQAGLYCNACRSNLMSPMLYGIECLLFSPWLAALLSGMHTGTAVDFCRHFYCTFIGKLAISTISPALVHI